MSEDPSAAPGNAPGDPFFGGAPAPDGAASFKTAFNAFKTPSKDSGGQSDDFGAKGRNGHSRVSGADGSGDAVDAIAAALERAMLDGAAKAVEREFGSETGGEDGGEITQEEAERMWDEIMGGDA